jgi:hypothetical protein
MTILVAEDTVACRSDVCDIWNVITDTERLNRAMGMNRLNIEPLSDASAARYLVSTHMGGLPVAYEERPYEWLYPKSFKILRKMRSGPILDYFGQTVNVAARLQGEARSGELVVEDALAARALELKKFVVERYDATLKGVEKAVRVARIRITPR